ncbi:MAG: methionyl-tRNA formyltransferase [Verrucomicrobia bacterium]|nr:methionyl-tRNA formyltransferase [Verrucomicrobiota bacterium]
MNIVFFGTSPFAVHILRSLLEHKLNIVAVVTRTDKPQGRSLKVSPPPVKQLVLQSHPDLPVLQPLKASTPEFAELLKKFKPDLFIVAAYGEILKNFILEIPRLGAINVHGSILPKYRGAAPIQRSLMNGDPETGITIIKMVLEMDAGDMLQRVKIPLSPEDTFGEMEQKLAEISYPALIKVIHDLEKGTLSPIPQDPSQASFAPKIASQETEIQWSRPAQEIHNLIRGISPQPGAWCWVEIQGEKKRLKIKRSQVAAGFPKGYFGENLAFTDKEWVVACGQGALRLLEVQLEGKKSLPIPDFLRGFHEPCKILA